MAPIYRVRIRTHLGYRVRNINLCSDIMITNYKMACDHDVEAQINMPHSDETSSKHLLKDVSELVTGVGPGS